MLQIVIRKFQATDLVVLDQKPKYLQSYQVEFAWQKYSKLVSIIVALQCWKFAFFFLPEHQCRMDSVSSFLTDDLIIFFKRFLRHNQSFQFIGECGDEVIDFLDCFRRKRPILPEYGGLKSWDDFYDRWGLYLSSSLLFSSWSYIILPIFKSRGKQIQQPRICLNRS